VSKKPVPKSLEDFGMMWQQFSNEKILVWSSTKFLFSSY